MSSKRIVIKIGTNVLTQADGLLDLTVMSHLVDQIVQIKKLGIEVVLVSSGAVGAGRSIYTASKTLSKVVQRQVFSAIGQVRLMQWYMSLFANYGLFCAQVLATKEDFRDRQHYLNMQNCLLGLLRDNLVPIVNENDVVAIKELMFTDNDELASLLAAMTNADRLIILSAVDGVFDGNPSDENSQLIRVIAPNDDRVEQVILPVKSAFGRGGMSTKVRMAKKAASMGIEVVIANGKRSNILTDIVSGDYIGTTFLAETPVSNVKKWMAYHRAAALAKIIVNEGAAQKLIASSEIISLLPIGIVAIEGEFEKGDLVQIIAHDGTDIALGLAQYDAATAQQYIGQRGKKALVHYDYLYII
ncbi:MAG: glutamate 5-kinase [Bacteroidota bacterium]